MAYISSVNNRFYVASEAAYGTIAAITAGNRIPAVKLTSKQQQVKITRQDKTGSRTFAGYPAGLRRNTTFQLQTYMTGWTDKTTVPVHSPLFEACLGGKPVQWGGGTIGTISNGTNVAFAAPHGLSPGQAIASDSEIRFVTAVLNNSTVQINAPFTNALTSGSAFGQSITYQPALDLGSVSIFDYWSPSTAVQRILSGAAVDQFKVKVNADIHEFQFSGPACDIVDSTTSGTGTAPAASFPAEPATTDPTYSIVPGHLGQIWLGSSPTQFFTVTSAEFTFTNNLDLRANEFGTVLPQAIVPGLRAVELDFSLYQQDDEATQALYQAARQRSPVSVMLQLGEQSGQLFGIYLKSVVLEIPDFDDSDKQQQWQFASCRAQGSIDDEVYIAYA